MPARLRLACLVLLTAAAAGCTGTPDEPPAAAARSTQQAPSVAEAQAAADAINLRAADLPGFRSTPEPAEDPATPDEDDPLLACVGAGGDEGIVETTSPLFTQGTYPRVQVTSNVDVYEDPARAARDLEAYQGERAVQCVAEFFATSAAKGTPPGSAFSEPRVTRSTPNAAGTDASVGFRVVTTLQTQGQQVPVSFRLLAYAKGRTQVALTITQFGAGAPDVDVDALFGVLVSRSDRAV